MVAQPLVSSPSIKSASAFSPVPLTPGHHLQRLETLSHCLAANAINEAVYPSLGQVGEEAKRVSTFLDLYRARARDDACLNKVKSPTSAEGGEEWAALEELTGNRPLRRKSSLRRSRSFDDMEQFTTRLSAAREDALTQIAEAPTNEISSHPGSLEEAKATIVNADAKRMASFRRRFGNRPRELRLAVIAPPPSLPLPSPPPPTALLKVKSPMPVAIAPRRLPQPPSRPRRLPQPVIVTAPVVRRASVQSPRVPYWIKSTPKTPRTMRSERRQGWGGSWEALPGISEVVSQLKEA